MTVLDGGVFGGAPQVTMLPAIWEPECD
ncbi:hypothetical protein [Mycobacterium leprae]|nr:hypothetical protein [Mycobacterium leprae]